MQVTPASNEKADADADSAASYGSLFGPFGAAAGSPWIDHDAQEDVEAQGEPGTAPQVQSPTASPSFLLAMSTSGCGSDSSMMAVSEDLYSQVNDIMYVLLVGP